MNKERLISTLGGVAYVGLALIVIPTVWALWVHFTWQCIGIILVILGLGGKSWIESDTANITLFGKTWKKGGGGII